MERENESLIGKTLTCAETGKQFVGAVVGFTTNYAQTADGKVYSDEGVHLLELRTMKEYNGEFGCYLSSDGKHVTGWKGNVLGRVISAVKKHWVVTENDLEGNSYNIQLYKFGVIDAHGRLWQGVGEGQGMWCTLTPTQIYAAVG